MCAAHKVRRFTEAGVFNKGMSITPEDVRAEVEKYGSRITL